ncbi:MAG: dihydroorotase family protein, partial [Candidatus Bathyarchaeia archaeon]
SYGPPTDSALRLRERMEVAKGKVVVNVGFYASFPSKVEEIDEIVEAGAIGFKVNPFQPLLALDVEDDTVLSRAFERAAGVDTVVAVHAEKRSLVRRLEERLKGLGDASVQAYLRAHPPRAEVEDVERAIRLAREARVRVHFSHISTSSAVSLIIKARGEGVRVSSEATPHNLLLSEETLSRLGGEAIMDPPLRSRAETTRLFEAVVKGDIDIVASDHAPHSLGEKRGESVWEVRPGVPGLETTLPVLLTMVNDGRLTINRLIKLLAQRPAQIFRLGGKGFLGPGYDADLTVVDLKESYTIDPSEFHSKAKYSPFRGWRAVGRPVKTLVGGRVVMEEGEVISSRGDGDILGCILCEC